MGNKRRTAVQISEEMLLDILGLDPSEFTLARVYHEHYGVVRLIIEGESLPEITEGQEAPIRDPLSIRENLDKYKENK